MHQNRNQLIKGACAVMVDCSRAKKGEFNMEMSHVVSLHRYPVKSMMGEKLNATEVDDSGCSVTRYAIVDSSDGKVASAKNSKSGPTRSTSRPN